MSNFATPLPRSARLNRGAADGDLMLSLEERITSLVERHREALKTIEELRMQLQQRDAEVNALSQRVEQRERVQDELRVRLDRLIDRIAQMQGACGTNGSPA
jgi:chromosome segregation ATPase